MTEDAQKRAAAAAPAEQTLRQQRGESCTSEGGREGGEERAEDGRAGVRVRDRGGGRKEREAPVWSK